MTYLLSGERYGLAASGDSMAAGVDHLVNDLLVGDGADALPEMVALRRLVEDLRDDAVTRGAEPVVGGGIGDAAGFQHADVQGRGWGLGAVARGDSRVATLEHPIASLQVALHRAVGEGEVVAPALRGASRAALLDALHRDLALPVVPAPVVAFQKVAAAAV